MCHGAYALLQLPIDGSGWLEMGWGRVGRGNLVFYLVEGASVGLSTIYRNINESYRPPFYA